MAFLRGQDLLPPSAASLHRPPNQHQRGLRLHLPSSPRSSPSSTPCALRQPLWPQCQGCPPCITPNIDGSHAGASHTITACGSAGAFYSTAAGDASGSAGTFPSAATAGASAIHAARRAPRGHGANTCATLGLASGLRCAMRGFVFVDPCTTDVVTAVPRCSTGDARSSTDVSDAEATGDTSNVGRCCRSACGREPAAPFRHGSVAASLSPPVAAFLGGPDPHRRRPRSSPLWLPCPSRRPYPITMDPSPPVAPPSAPIRARHAASDEALEHMLVNVLKENMGHRWPEQQPRHHLRRGIPSASLLQLPPPAPSLSPPTTSHFRGFPARGRAVFEGWRSVMASGPASGLGPQVLCVNSTLGTVAPP